MFELNLEKIRLVCLFCHDPSTMQRVFDVTGVEFERFEARSQKFRNFAKVSTKRKVDEASLN